MRCSFTDQRGVGDTMNSYAYDGKRRRKWNGTEEDYGLFWSPGDVVGVRIDLEVREVSIYLSSL
jgi:Kip1 ubiquitination-promoting complex protein 1